MSQHKNVTSGDVGDWIVDWDAIITALTTTAVIVAALTGAAAFLGKSIVSWLTSRDLEHFKAQLAAEKTFTLEQIKSERASVLEELKSELQQQTKRQDHISLEIRRWSNPVSLSLDSLIGRLENILDEEGYVALEPTAVTPPGWSITHDYFLMSTLFIFGQYFCWTQLMRERVSFEIFEGNEEADKFFALHLNAGRTISSFPLSEVLYEELGEDIANDMQVFLQQQRQMGEVMIVTDRLSHGGCLRYSEFVERWMNRNTPVNLAFTPLQEFLTGVSPSRKIRWRRLQDLLTELRTLRSVVVDILERE